MKAHDPDDIRFAPNIVVHATLAGIGLSIIDSKPRELLYVSLLDFDVGFMDSDWSRVCRCFCFFFRLWGGDAWACRILGRCIQ